MTTAEVLQKARDLIADESRWTHGYFARDEHGFEVEAIEPSACKWCAIGAVYRVLDFDDDGGMAPMPEAAYALPRNIVDINDRGDHAAVLAAFDEAIAAEAA